MAGYTYGGDTGAQYGTQNGGLYGLPLLFAPESLSVSNVSMTAADLSWIDNNPDEYAVVVERGRYHADIDEWGPWREIATLDPNTESFTDDSLLGGWRYRWRVYASNAAGIAHSNEAEATTDETTARDKVIPTNRPYVEIDHPDSPTPLTPDVAEDGFQRNPIANDLPRIEIPVERDEKWQADAFDEADMRVWDNGERQPIDTLVRVRMEPGRTVLIGRGGSELLERYETEIEFEDAHVAARDAVTETTDYETEFDDPASDIDDDVEMAQADSNPQWSSFVAEDELDSSTPATIEDGTLTGLPTARFVSGEDGSGMGNIGTGLNPTFEGGEFVYFGQPTQGWETTVQFEHDIDAGDLGFAWRGGYDDGSHPKIEWVVNGEIAFTVDADQDFTSLEMPRWFTRTLDGGVSADENVSISYELESTGTSGSTTFTADHGSWVDLTPDTTNIQNVTIEETGTAPVEFDEGDDYEIDYGLGQVRTLSDGAMVDGESYSAEYIQGASTAHDDSPVDIDCIAVYDTSQTIDVVHETLDSGGSLSWPNIGPQGVGIETQDYTTPFTVIGGGAEGSFNDTQNGQAIAVSNDQGQDWTEATNQPSVDEPSFTEESQQIRGRFTLSYFDEGGASGTTLSGIQRVDLGTLLADLDDTPTIANDTQDGQLKDVLANWADSHNFLWEVRWDATAESQAVHWTQPGQRFNDDPGEVSDYQIDKQTEDLVEQLTVYGSSQQRKGEQFIGRHEEDIGESEGILDQTDLIELQEAVLDSSNNQYTRGEDYGISFLNGEVWVLETGEMEVGETYEIDYEYKTQGTYPEEGDAPADAREDTQTIPGLGSERICEQTAYYVVQRSKNPIWEGTVSLPKQELGWTVIDAIDPDEVPTSGNQLEIRGITETPSSIDVDIRNRRTVDEIVQDLTSSIESVKDVS